MCFGTHLNKCHRCHATYFSGDCITYECPDCELARLQDSVLAAMPFCTLTGVDDHVDLDRLWELAKRYPFVEWGVLFSETEQGKGRYPSFGWISNLVSRMRWCSPPNFAMHVCGRGVQDLLAGEGKASEFAHYFRRVQINFRSDRYPLEAIREAIWLHPGKTIITQHNAVNQNLWRQLSDLPNHAVLFGESGGKGQERLDWPAPLDIESERLPFKAANPACGYAGGLGPDNLATQLPRIHAAAAGKPYWIDMEGKLRDQEDRFDLKAAERCLEIVSAFLLKEAA